MVPQEYPCDTSFGTLGLILGPQESCELQTRPRGRTPTVSPYESCDLQARHGASCRPCVDCIHGEHLIQKCFWICGIYNVPISGALRACSATRTSVHLRISEYANAELESNEADQSSGFVWTHIKSFDPLPLSWIQILCRTRQTFPCPMIIHVFHVTCAACGQMPALRQRCHWLVGLIEAFWTRNRLALHSRSLDL